MGKQYVVGQAVGVCGLILVSEPKDGKAKFRHPDGNHKFHRIIDVERGMVTGRRRGRPQGLRNSQRSLAERYDAESAVTAARQCDDPQRKRELQALAVARKKNDDRRKKWNEYQKEYRRRKRYGI